MRTIYAIYDNKAKTLFGPLMTEHSVHIALRTFANVMRDDTRGNNIRNHPKDFDLYQLAHLDQNDETRITADPRVVCLGTDMLAEILNTSEQ